MHRFIFSVGLLLLVSCLHAAEPKYLRDLAKWQAVAVPSESDQEARVVWSYAAAYSEHEWQVSTKDGKPHAQLSSELFENPSDRPSFTPKAGQFRMASEFAALDDGWLVGFNQGEFGAALYWFSQDGDSSYKISDHQVVDFFSLSNGVHAIEGVAHLSLSRGSVIRIERPKGHKQWRATTIAKLPFAPYAVSVRRDGLMLIVLSDSLVSMGHDCKIQTLLPKPPWHGLYPNSSVLSQDEQRLYIGMRQYVGEFSMATKKLRLLIPSHQFLHKLPKDEEEQIRKQYRR